MLSEERRWLNGRDPIVRVRIMYETERMEDQGRRRQEGRRKEDVFVTGPDEGKNVVSE